MGQKTNPIGNRLGIIRGWDSAWYGGKKFGDKIAEDSIIRKYVFARLAKASVSKVIIERFIIEEDKIMMINKLKATKTAPKSFENKSKY